MRESRDNFDVAAFYAALDSQRAALNMSWMDVAALCIYTHSHWQAS